MTRQTETSRRLDEIEKLLGAIDKTLAINTEHLAEHMRRTAKIEQEMDPVVKHVQQMKGAAKLLGLLAIIATIVSAFAWYR